MAGETIETSLNLITPVRKKGHGIVSDIEELGESLRRYSWTTLAELKGNRDVLTKLEETERLLKDLKRALS